MTGRDRSRVWLYVYAPLAAVAAVSLALVLGTWWTK